MRTNPARVARELFNDCARHAVALDPARVADRWPVEGLLGSAASDPGWWYRWGMGPNVLWLTESLTQLLDLRPGMRVLDLGCGSALSSIFLARECGCRVWAADLWVEPSDNWVRIVEADATDLVTPVKVEAHALPFADGFFDAVVSIDAYHSFGTDELYLGELAGYVRNGGRIAVVAPGHVDDDDGAELSFHSDEWWARLWTRNPGVTVGHAGMLPGGHELWRRSDAVSTA